MVEKNTENKNLEREYVIPLRSKFMHVPRYKKTPKAVKTVKEFLARHMKIRDRDLNKIKLDKALNEYLWFRGIKNPPHKVKVKASFDSNGLVRAELSELSEKLKFKKLREEKIIAQAKEAVEKKKGLMEKAKESLQGGAKKAEASKENADNNKDGIEDKVEQKEKEESVKASTEKMEKDLAKEAKHESKVQSPKEQSNSQKDFNKSSRGR